MLGYLSAFISSIATSAGNISAKEALNKEHSREFIVFSSILSFLLLSPLALFVLNGNIDAGNILLIYIGSLFWAVSLFLSAHAMRHLELSTFIPLFNINVVFTVLLGFLVLGEIIDKLQSVGILLVIIGAYTLEAGHHQTSILEPLKRIWRSSYIHYLVAGAFFASMSALVDKVVLETTSIPTFLFLAYAFLSLNTALIFTFFYKESWTATLRDGRILIGWLFLFSISRVSASIFYAYALTIVPLGIVVTLRRLSTLFSVILGGKLLHEGYIAWKAFASTLIVAGAVLIVF